MELAKITSEYVITEEFRHGAESFTVTFNADLFSPEYFRSMERAFSKQFEAAREEDKAKHPGFFKRLWHRIKPPPQNRLIEESLIETARSLEIQRDLYSEILAAHVLKDWGLTVDGVPIKPTKEVLARLPPRFVKDLYTFCVEKSLPKGQPTPVTEINLTTDETTRPVS